MKRYDNLRINVFFGLVLLLSGLILYRLFVLSVLKNSFYSLTAEAQNENVANILARGNIYVKDGETIILGGLITENQLEERNNTPLLDKIPLARKLFSRREKSAKRSELVVFITPHIITSSRTPPSMKPKIAGGAM